MRQLLAEQQCAACVSRLRETVKRISSCDSFSGGGNRAPISHLESRRDISCELFPRLLRRVLVHREGVISSSVRLHAPLRSLPSALLQLVLPVRLNTFRVAEAAERFLTFPLSHGSGVQNLDPEVFKRGDPPRRIKSCTESFPAPSSSPSSSRSPFPRDPLFRLLFCSNRHDI